MRLRRLDLSRYGKFTDRGIDFGEAAEGQAEAVRPFAFAMAAYLAVENTYLATFQALGGLGLLLGALGLAVVLLRSVWERRGELALLRSTHICAAPVTSVSFKGWTTSTKGIRTI